MISRHEPDTDQLLTSSTRSAVSAKQLERERLEAAIREFETRRGPVTTQPIIKRCGPKRPSTAVAPPAESDDMLSQIEAAEILGVDARWLSLKHVTCGGPQGVKKGRKVMYPRAEIERYKAVMPEIIAESKANRSRYGRGLVLNGSAVKRA